MSSIACPVGPPPFNQPTADITLRTADRVDFHVHTHILAQASPIFSGMFSLPQPPKEIHNPGTLPHRPTVDVTEDSKTLERLLRLCYPINKQGLGELDDIVPVLIAATKYEMEWPLSLLTNDLLAVAPKRPLKVWAVACQTGLEVVAHRAACAMRERATNTAQCLPVLEVLLREEGLPALDGVYAGDYYRLREFLRLTVTDMSFKLLLGSSWSPPSTFLSGFLSTLQPLSPARPITTPPSSAIPVRPLRKSLRVFTVPSTPAPDLVLKCPDGRQLRAHQLIVSLHSTPLKTKLEAAREEASADVASPTGSPTRVWSTSLPAIDVDLDSRTLSALLGVLYEGEERLPSDLSDLAALLLAAWKYAMSRVARVVEARWESEAAQSPLEAYFVASQHNLDSYATTAARKVLEKSLKGWYTTAMESSPALAYQRLLQYYQACAQSVNEDIRRVADRFQAAHPSGGWGVAVVDREIIPKYLRDLGSRIVVGGPVCRDKELALPELFRSSCVEGDYYGPHSSWPQQTKGYCHELVKAMLDIGSELRTSVPNAISQVKLDVA
ncbi:hypothetical protein L226DRAFT_524131 [Lentinus tigrinus ALCF2SS1-7]|uniref:BTB domain-containing protein n=1 Tax=Lentinus tigrinus ALCF2SS1-6 TaxID=1328759 RepID=A0A5C2S5F3_9APHY|nr:hypothetical protein L227DRAFT_601667 [Lentinus tigrinus ALCF2SS1-6]RPD73321.1 hypothetical protein L226DRAFT_524131 [Lentinus tigrinus ALCF2SS1-7]